MSEIVGIKDEFPSLPVIPEVIEWDSDGVGGSEIVGIKDEVPTLPVIPEVISVVFPEVIPEVITLDSDGEGISEMVGIKDVVPSLPVIPEVIAEVITLDSDGDDVPMVFTPPPRRRTRRRLNMLNIPPRPPTIVLGDDDELSSIGNEVVSVVPGLPAATPVDAPLVTPVSIPTPVFQVFAEPGPSLFSTMKKKWEAERAELKEQVMKLQRENEAHKQRYAFVDETAREKLKENQELAEKNKELGDRIKTLEAALQQANQKEQEPQKNEEELDRARATIQTQEGEIGNLKARVEQLERFRHQSVANAKAVIKRSSTHFPSKPSKRSNGGPPAASKSGTREGGGSK